MPLVFHAILRATVKNRLAALARRALDAHPLGAGVAAGVVACALCGAGLARAEVDPPDILKASEVKPGMKGYGLTVFSGTTPEKFDVEIISTIHNFRPNQDLFLIKTPNHPRLDASRTVAGMSGSPIYINGKMIGAYAYGWLFGVEPIAGVTPIKNMLDEAARPMPKTILPIAGAGPLPSNDEKKPAKANKHARLFQGSPEGYDLAEHAKQVAASTASALAPPEKTSLARASTPVMLGGMTNVGLKIATDVLGAMGLDPLQAGGGSATPDKEAPTKYMDGGAIGIELVKGDVSAMGLGTVTRVSGDKLVAFGHPMLGGGIEALPTAVAKVHWILANLNRSFKIGEAVRSMGALVNDRQAAIVVDSTAKAPTFPVKLDVKGVEGAPKKAWSMEVTADPFMAPSFVAMALGSAAEATAAERRDATYRAVHKLKIEKYGTIELIDAGWGNGIPISADDFIRGRLVRAVGALLNNPWEQVKIEGVETTLTMTMQQDTYRLRGAKILEPIIDAGQPVHVRLDLQPHLGKLESKVIEIPIPKELAGHELDIELAAGFEVERPLATPDSVAELVALLPNQFFDAESIVATFRLRENGAAYRGKVASRLPPGMLDTLRPTTASEAPEAFSSQVQIAIPLKKFLLGRDQVHVEVRQVLR